MKQIAHVRRQDANTIAGKGKKKQGLWQRWAFENRSRGNANRRVLTNTM